MLLGVEIIIIIIIVSTFFLTAVTLAYIPLIIIAIIYGTGVIMALPLAIYDEYKNAKNKRFLNPIANALKWNWIYIYHALID